MHFEGTGRIERQLDCTQQPLTISSVVSYDLDEFQEMIPAPDHDNPHDRMPGLKWVSGFLFGFVRGHKSLLALPDAGTTWTLNLEDGRRIKLLVELIENQRVVVKSTGGFF
jgi:hypothetical protein